MKRIYIFILSFIGVFGGWRLTYAQDYSECLKFLSYYKEYFNHGEYENAINNWREAFSRCPVRIGQRFYNEGAELYRWKADQEAYRNAAILDTLVMINAIKAYIYPNTQVSANREIETDINRYAQNNEALRRHLISEIKNVSAFLSESKVDKNSLKFERVSRVAITNPRKVSGAPLSRIEQAIIKGEICKAISRSQDYIAYTRTDVDKLLEEHQFQSTGLVSENERHQIGQLSGVDYICPINVFRDKGVITIEASLINIQTGIIHSSSSGYCQYASINDAFALEMISKQIGQELSSSSSSKKINIVASRNPYPKNGEPYIETAFGVDMKLNYIEGGVYGEGTESQQYISPFYIGVFEVTQAQWENVMGTTQEDVFKVSGYRIDKNSIGNNYPVFCVTPQDALDFCKALSQMSNLEFDLPTSAEWNMASQGKSESFYYSGSDVFSDVGWEGKAMPVGLKRPNSNGLYDMTGNVAELCRLNNHFGIKAGTPWGDFKVRPQNTFSDIDEDSSSPYVGFRVIMRNH